MQYSANFTMLLYPVVFVIMLQCISPECILCCGFKNIGYRNVLILITKTQRDAKFKTNQ